MKIAFRIFRVVKTVFLETVFVETVFLSPTENRGRFDEKWRK